MATTKNQVTEFDQYKVRQQFELWLTCLGAAQPTPEHKEEIYMVFLAGYSSSFFICTNDVCSMADDRGVKCLDVLHDDLVAIGNQLLIDNHNRLKSN